jgi:hypothetical protein
MKLFTPHLEALKTWLLGAANEYSNPGMSRTFVSDAFKAESLNWRYLRDTLFDRKESNAKYVQLHKETDLTKRKPIVYMQKDINATHGMHKSFVVRYKTRLQVYRDDYANKAYRLPSSINNTLGIVDATNTRIRGEE